MKIKILVIVLMSLTYTSSFSQSRITQTIRGTVIDKDSRSPLPGANITILNSDPVIGTSADINGRFRIENIPIGKTGIKVTYIGFNEVVIPDFNVLSGKETIIDVEMEEMAVQSPEVVISANSDKSSVINEMAMVSARSFTIDETNRYAGSYSDVSRMASNFAGVRGTDDSRNDIIIRGNSPMGLLWRLEGVDIPNPNHFGATEGTGGPVNMLNNNLLANSDFITGAFPAEYGNAISGVFDLKLRNGNDEKHEFLGQVGFNGFELGAEGPLSKNNGSSYIINYRYSVYGLFKAIGVDFGTGTAIPEYQDLSFKVNLPRTKLGSFSLFGIGGISDITFLASERDTTEDKIDFYGGEGFDLVNGSNVAVAGLTHTYFWNSNTYSKIILSATYHNYHTDVDTISPADHEIIPYFRNSHKEDKLMGTLILNKKLNSKHTLRTGITFTRLNINFTDSLFNDDTGRFDLITSFKGDSYFAHPYFQWLFKINNNLTLNSGLHYMQFFYNNSWSLEPRISARWKFTNAQSLSLGFGMHSQVAPITVYFSQSRLPDDSYIQPNKNLDFTKSSRIVLGYDLNISAVMRLKAEVYYQNINNAGVDGNERNSFSILNQGANFYTDAPDTLVNNGTGRNFGIEVTLEKFMSKGLYFLVTASLYDSKYKGSDDVERNTAFNGSYIVNGLIGKEWNFGGKRAKTVKSKYTFFVDLKTTLAGGQRYTSLTAVPAGPDSYVAEYDDENAFANKYKDYFRTDMRIALRQNARRFSIEMALDFQNLLNTKNIFAQQFNTKTGETDYTYQLGMQFIPQLKILF